MKRIVLIVLAVVAFGLIGIVFVRYHLFVDFPATYLGASSLISGRSDLYSPEFSGGPLFTYTYPPFFILIFAPLGLVSYRWAAYIWYCLCVLEIAGTVFVLRRAVRKWQAERSSESGGHAVWLIALFAVGQYFVLGLHAGNPQLLITFLLFGSFYFAMCRKEGWAALLMSLAISIKLIPILALPYFALKRRWGFLTLVSLFILIINVIPATYFGFGKNAELLETWYERVLLNQGPVGRVVQINLSLKGQLRRYVTRVDYSERAEGTGSTDTDYASVNVVSLSPTTSDYLWLALSAGLYMTGLLLIWQASRNSRGWFTRQPEPGTQHVANSNSNERRMREPIEYGLVICMILLVGPWTAKMYFMQLLWPVTFLATLAWSDAGRALNFSKYILFFIASANFVLPLLPGRSIQRLILVTGIDFYLTCLLTLVLMYVLISYRRLRDDLLH